MSVSLYKIKKWVKMLSGKSVFHVNQDKGKIYSKTRVLGYYNNLTEKITRFGLPDDEVPQYYVDTGEKIYFSISIFQYGLAAYDLFLLNNDESMLKKLKNCADWAVENQKEDGSWVTFAYENKELPYSSMAQGEGISMLVRAYRQFGNEVYGDSAKKALNFLLVPIDSGGVSRISENELFLYEYAFRPLVLNGWIFSAWGIYDFAKTFNDESAMMLWNKAVNGIANNLYKYDCGYWSMYTQKTIIASPFYHKLNIAQLNVMFDLTGRLEFKQYADRFLKYQNSFICRKRAFFYKAWQKIID